MSYLAYKFPIYPTKEQETRFMKQIGSIRWLWNRMLAMNNQKYESEQKFIFYNEMSEMLPSLKSEFEWLKESNSQTLQTIIKTLDSSLNQFFKRKNDGVGFPKFKAKHHSALSFPVPQHFSITNSHVKIPKIGEIKWKRHRKIYGTPKRLTISKDVDKWFCSVMCETPDSPELLEIANSVGIDLGIKSFAVTSDGEIIDPPDYKKLFKQIKKLQRNLERKTKGSNNTNKARIRLAKKHREIRNKRLDFHHKQSYLITKNNDLVVFENLNIAGMLKNSKLARSISEQGWYQFKTLTKQKMARKGGFMVEIGKFYPSTKTCSSCGWIQQMKLSDRIYECGNCGHSMDRDLNAAININNEGKRLVRLDKPELKLVESHGENQCAVQASILQDSVKQEAPDALALESMSQKRIY